MAAVKLLLLSFVGLCLGDIDSIWNNYNSDKCIENLKELIKFADTQIFNRWWATEELTCKEIDAVLQTMQQSIESDLDLLMSDVRKYISQVPPRNSRKMKNCIRYIRGEVEDIVREGVEHFSRCTAALPPLDTNEVNEKRVEYDESIRYTLENLDSCLLYSTIRSEVHRRKCVENMLQDNEKNINETCYSFSESKCMAHFENKILKCVTEVFDEISDKKRSLEETIYKCVKYNSSLNNPENFGNRIKYALSNYMDKYGDINRKYDDMVLQSFGRLFEASIEREDDLKIDYFESLKNLHQAYYDALNRTKEENRSDKQRSCSDSATESLNNIISQASTDYAECRNFTNNEQGDVISTLKDVIRDFNSRLPELGNVAMLRCLSERPQVIFGSETIATCANLAFGKLTWEYDLVTIQINNIVRKSEQNAPTLLPNGKTCGQLRERKLILEAEKVLYDCTRCLYRHSGDYYAVTTPTAITTTYMSDEEEDYFDPDSYYGITYII